MNRRQLLVHYRRKRVDAHRCQVVQRMNKKTLDRAKGITGSDSQTAKRIGTSKQQLSDIRHGRRPMSPYVACQLARLLKLPLFPEIARALAQRAHTQKNRDHWLDVAVQRWPERALIYENLANSPKVKEYPTR